ncbi:hypothetical protein TRVA0_028S00408 [Trichomonascus vanleenenianus]|uniref:uncharacterized protein n=1 Tax=Trichomonascus vanleenenianus TaxID=2268995 RepID=UPI003ECB11E2
MEALGDVLGESDLERIRQLAEAMERRLVELEGVVFELRRLKAEYNAHIADRVSPERDEFIAELQRIDSTSRLSSTLT